jgi:hypothetical protein
MRGCRWPRRRNLDLKVSDLDDAVRKFSIALAKKRKTGVPVAPSIETTETVFKPRRVGFELARDQGVGGFAGGGGTVPPPPPPGNFLLLEDNSFLLLEDYTGIELE